MIRAVLLLLCLFLAKPAAADELKPAYLQLTQREATVYDVLWKVPALDENTTLALSPILPKTAVALTPPRASYARGWTVIRWRVKFPGGLEGQTVAFTGLSKARSDVLARVVGSNGTAQLERIVRSNPQFQVKTTPSASEVAWTYTWLGTEHILIGFDHLCFVLALVMIVGLNRRLVWTVTAFTLAHSITLALATLGMIHMPGPPVEAIIALSIVFVASEVVQQQRGRTSLAARKPGLIAFTFGLLHGLGFAGALAEIGLPENAVPLALLFFNFGVEIGQLLFIAAVFAATRFIFSVASNCIDVRRAAIVPAYLIGGIASYWVIERISNFSP